MKAKLASLLLFFSALAHASPQQIPIVWPFSVGSNQVNFIRTIIDDANRKQNKYNFYVEFKPGAGGTVAAQYVDNYKSVALLSISSSFFVRPHYYPTESHKVENFKPVLIECTGQPLAIISKKFTSIDELKNQKRLTIGANHGSLTEALVRQLQQVLPDTELTLVPYSGTVAGTQEVLADRLDLNVELPAEAMQHVEAGKLNVIGISGTKDHKNMRSFNSQGFKGSAGVIGTYAMYVRKDVDPNVVKELHEIFTKASTTAGSRLQDLYNRDFCPAANLSLKETNETFDRWVKYWPEKLSNKK
jgi:tripartite-type tricarboxylate transporter receptor subunit TctC